MKQLKYLIILLVAGWCLPVFLWAQAKQEKARPLEIYIFPRHYSPATKDYLSKNGVSTARLLYESVIVSGKKKQLDTALVKRYVSAAFPDPNVAGLIVVDWESRLFDDLKRFKRDDERFKNAEATYIQLVRAAKSARPKVRIGIYGLPFRVFYDTQQQYNEGNKFDRLLSACDYIAPSLYILYTDEQIGREKNIAYLKRNLDNALYYGTRLNKPVMPFVWYRVNPGNRQFSNKILPQEQVQRYLSFIAGYKYQNVGIKGIFWWEEGRKDRDNNNGSVRQFSTVTADPTGPDSVLLKYMGQLIK
jgi:hypothetical protein